MAYSKGILYRQVLLCLNILACIFCLMILTKSSSAPSQNALVAYRNALPQLNSAGPQAQQTIPRESFNENQHLDYLSRSRNKTNGNFDRHVIYPWENDPSCAHFSIQLADIDSLPKWPLTSFPGSGVTWTRQIVEGVTGIYTGSVYQSDPPPIIAKGNVSASGITDDTLCGCTIMDKDHEATIATQGFDQYFRLLHKHGHAGLVHQQYDGRGILLLRNPLDVVFTFRHWQLTGKVGNAGPEAFEGPEWDEVVDYVAYAWADHANRWIEQIKEGTAIFYEYLLDENEAETEVRRLLDTIGFKMIDPDRLRCALAHRNRTDHKRVNKPRVPLLAAHRRKLMKAMHEVQQSLRRRRWERLPIYMFDLHDS